MKCFSHLRLNNSEEGAHTTENTWHGISCHRVGRLPWPIIAIEQCSDYQPDSPFEATLSYHRISCNRLVEPSRILGKNSAKYASVVASDQSNENVFSNLTSFCKSTIVLGLFMSCGFNVKNNEEQPDQTRRAKNFGISVSLSDSEPRTLR